MPSPRRWAEALPLAGLGRSLWSKPYLLLVLTTIVWGGNAVAARLAVGELSPMVLVAMRWLIVVAILGALVRPSPTEQRLIARHWLSTLLMATLGFTVFNAMFYVAAETTTAVNIGMIQGIMPGLALVGSFVAYGTPIGRAQVVGLAVALVGVAVVVSRGHLETLLQARFVAGDVWMLIASVFYAGYGVALQRRPATRPLVFFAALAVGAFVTTLPLLAWEIAAGRAVWPGPKGWAILAFVGLFPSLISQIFFMRGIELIGAGRASLFINLVPVFAAILAVGVLGEEFGVFHAVALALVLGGIWLAERGRPAPPPATGRA